MTRPRPAQVLDNPHAQLVMTNEQIGKDRAAWLDARRADPAGNWRLTASEMAAVAGVAPVSWDGGSPYALYQAKLSGDAGWAGNDRTEFGLFAEPYVAGRFAAEHPDLEVIDGGLYLSAKTPWLGATFDRLACDVRQRDDRAGLHQMQMLEWRAPVQLKTWADADRASFGEPGSGDVPLHMRVQDLMEMAVAGTDLVYEPVTFLPSCKTVTYVIERDRQAEDQIAALLAAGEEFIALLNEERPPAIDWTPATTAALRRQYDKYDGEAKVDMGLAARYHAARLAAAAARQQLEQCKNELRAAGGNAKRLLALDPITGTERTVATRSGSLVREHTVREFWRDEIRAGAWGTP
jgi:hypothetical protein